MMAARNPVLERHPPAAARSGPPSLFGRQMAVVPASPRPEPSRPLQAAPPAPGTPVASRPAVPIANVRQYLFQLNATMQEATRTQTRDIIIGLTAAEVEGIARSLARLRARYLANVLEIGAAARGFPTGAEIAQLRRTRETYEELRLGFDGLRAALENGEVSLESAGRG